MVTLKNALSKSIEVILPYINELNEMAYGTFQDPKPGKQILTFLLKKTDRNLDDYKAALKDLHPDLLYGKNRYLLDLFFESWPEQIDSVPELQEVLKKADQAIENSGLILDSDSLYDGLICWPEEASLTLTEFFTKWLNNIEQRITTVAENDPLYKVFNTFNAGVIGVYYLLAGIALSLGIPYEIKHFYLECHPFPGNNGMSSLIKITVKTEYSQGIFKDLFQISHKKFQANLDLNNSEILNMTIVYKNIDWILYCCKTLGQIREFQIELIGDDRNIKTIEDAEKQLELERAS